MPKFNKRRKALYYVPVKQKYLSKWEYYKLDLDMLNDLFLEVQLVTSLKDYLINISSSDFVFCWWWHRSPHIVLLSKLFNKMVFVTGAVHMYDERTADDFFTKGFLFRLFCRFSWRFADCNILISESQLRQITSHEKVNNPIVLKSSVSKNFSFPTSMTIQSSKKNSENLNKFLTIIWQEKTSIKRKGVLESLQAIKLLLQGGETNFEWIIAGEEGSATAILKRQIYDLKLEKYVKIMTNLSNSQKMELYKANDLYIQPSHYEGFGNSVLEAMSYGNIALVSSATSQPEVVQTSGFIVTNVNSEQIAKKLKIFCQMSFREKSLMKKETLEIVKKFHLYEYRLKNFNLIIEKLL